MPVVVALLLATARQASAIIGGSPDPVDTASVFVLFIDPANPAHKVRCSGTLVSPRVVLTAAICVRDAAAGGYVDNGLVFFGDSVEAPTATIAVVDQRTYRLYESGYGDVAVLLLAADGPVAPAILNEADLAPLVVPGTTQVTAVGYGTDDPSMTNFWLRLRRSVDMTAESLGPRTFAAGEPGKNTCSGDAGGPIILPLGGQRIVVGLSGQLFTCLGPMQRWRVDPLIHEFIYPAIDLWEGPCRLDSICVTVGCRTPDPDCDPCAPEGTCVADCPEPDWDCPVGGFVGDPCTDAFDCESRSCQPAVEDPRVAYCTERCDPAVPSCPVFMACTPVGTETLCTYTGITPRTQGSVCATAADCRSGMCDLVDRICVEPCDMAAGDAACPAGYECAPSSFGRDVCRSPQPAVGFCRTGTRKGTGWSLLLVVVAVLLGYARRRRRRATKPTSSSSTM